MKSIKLAAVVLCIAVLTLSLSGCSAKKEFSTEADKIFSELSEQKAVGTSQQEIVYSKTGSYALNLLKTDSAAVDKTVADYMSAKRDEFLKSVQSDVNKGNKFFADYSCFKASDKIIGVVVKITETSVDGVVLSNQYKTFNFDISRGAEISKELLSDKLKNRMVKYLNKYSTENLDGEMKFDLNSAELDTSVLSENGIIVHINDFKNKVQIPYAEVARQLDASLRETLSITTINGTVIRDVDPEKPMVALTFDDGPNSKNTEKILDILEEYDCVATFFELSENLKYAPDAVRRAEKLGCEIGSHTATHANLTKLSASGIKAELKRANDEFERILGHKPTLVRPPYGSCNDLVKANCDQYLIGWSVDTEDWKSRNADAVIQSIKRESSLNGDVILMHSLYDSTVEATKQIIPWLISEGYQIVTVSELIEYGYDSELTLGKYYSYNFFTGLD